MVDWVGVVFGILVAVFGVLSAMNHSFIDFLNRWMKSIGTEQRPSQIEMSETSVVIGRFTGAVLLVVGIAIVVGGI